MKTLLLTLIVSAVSMANCTIKLDKKSEKAKTHYVNGISVSQKIIDALSSQCKISVSVLSKDQVKQMTIDSLRARLAKLTSN